MRLSKKVDYALRALLSLAEAQGSGPLSLAHIARENAVPKRFLEHIMLQLKRARWVRSSTGCRGGYRLATSTERITLGEVIRVLDGSPASYLMAGDRKLSDRCRFRRVFLEILEYIEEKLNTTTLHEAFAIKA